MLARRKPQVALEVLDRFVGAQTAYRACSCCAGMPWERWGAMLKRRSLSDEPTPRRMPRKARWNNWRIHASLGRLYASRREASAAERSFASRTPTMPRNPPSSDARSSRRVAAVTLRVGGGKSFAPRFAIGCVIHACSLRNLALQEIVECRSDRGDDGESSGPENVVGSVSTPRLVRAGPSTPAR